MRIGVDGRALVGHRTGMGIYLLNILKILQDIDKNNEYFIYAHRNFNFELSNPRWHNRVGKGFFSSVSTLWILSQARHWILKDKIDVFWGAQQVFPWGLKCRKVLSVYDFVWHYYPRMMFFRHLLTCRLFVPYAIKQAEKLVCISQSVSDELVNLFVVPVHNVFIVHCAASSHFTPLNQKETQEYVYKKYDISQKYILHVGTIEPRKNVVSLLKAFQYGIEVLGLNHQLVIVGGKGWGMPSLYKMVEGLRLIDKHIKFLGYVPESDLPFLYSGADVFVFPSVYEGFGMPVLEAMSCGSPVIISSAVVLKEVAGASGVVVNPSDTVSFAKAIMQVVSDKALNQQLRESSLKSASVFSWERSGRKMLEILTTNW